MLHKTVALISALPMLVVGASAPANAAPVWNTGWTCVTDSDVQTCLNVTWTTQDDGDGVRLEGMQVQTYGCAKLEGGYNGESTYSDVTPMFIHPDGTLDYQYNFGDEPCDFFKDVSNAGKDTGRMELKFKMKARVNNARDHWVHIYWTLKPNGERVLDYKATPTA